MSKKEQTKNRWLFPLILTAFIPLVMYYHPFDTKLDVYPWFGAAMEADVFLYYKMVLMILLSIIMLFGIVIYYYQTRKSSLSKGKREERMKLFAAYRTWLPLLVYVILSFLSTIFSQYSYWGWYGISQQMEPVWVLAGYAVLAYYAYIFVQTAGDLFSVIKWLLISSGIVGLIGAFQAFGLDFYKTSLGKVTYLPSSLLKEQIEFVFEKGRTYASLYNPNYVGVYVSLLLPIVIVLIFFNKNRKLLAFYVPLAMVLIISLFGSGSKSGMLCIAASMLLLIFLFRKKLLEKWKFLVAGIAVLVVAFLGVNALKGNQLTDSLIHVLNTSKSEAPVLSKIETNDDNVTIVYGGNILVFRYAEDQTELAQRLSLSDGEGKTIAVSEVDEETLALQDERFPGFTAGMASYEDILFFEIKIDGTSWYFTNQNGDNTYYYLTITGKLDKIEQANASKLLEGRETFASNRGYIWSRTFPLLKKHVLLGSGADSFLLVYPNDEYVGKYNYGYGEQNISKPHNLYLQIGVQTGVVSLFAFLLFYGIYFVSSLRLYLKSKMDNFEVQMGAAILTGTAAYMLMGLANDSCIAVAPVFWLLIGLGTAINYQLKKAA